MYHVSPTLFIENGITCCSSFVGRHVSAVCETRDSHTAFRFLRQSNWNYSGYNLNIPFSGV